jgi:hypothetical protein
MNEDIFLKRKHYYSKVYVKLEIVKCLYHRELCFLRDKKLGNPKHSIRYLMGYNLYFLDRYLKICEERFVNMYHSVATLKYIPAIFDLRNRKKDENYIDFMNNFKEYIVGYDFFVDFDGKNNLKECHLEAKEYKEILEKFKVPYYLLNSSEMGFHFIIPFEYLPKLEIENLRDTIRNIICNMKAIYFYKHLDNSIYDYKRVKKVPYSFVCDGTIVLPLNDEQFNNFSKEIVISDYVLSNISLKERGLLIRTYNLSKEKLKENVDIFFNEYK